MCQEVGHTLGLDHQDETRDNRNLGSCMDYTNDPDGGAGGASATDPSNEHPNQHDYNQLVTIYSHTDLRTTVGGTSAASTLPPAANQGAFNRRDEWGRKIRESRDEQVALYVRDFCCGAKLFTWVIEAQPFERDLTRAGGPRLLMGVPALLYALIHPSAWKERPRKVSGSRLLFVG